MNRILKRRNSENHEIVLKVFNIVSHQGNKTTLRFYLFLDIEWPSSRKQRTTDASKDVGKNNFI